MRIFILFFLLINRSLLGQLPDSDPFVLVNSSYDEQNPVLSPDGQTLFFTISNHPENYGGRKDPGDIWFSTWAGNQWSVPVHGGKMINDQAYNGVANLSLDGSKLFLLSHYGASGNVAKTQGLSVSRLTGNSWSKPENILIPYFQNKSTLAGGHVAITNSIFIFSAETYGSYGVEDIYISLKKEDGSWTEPKNLGSKINTKFQELCPSLSLDGRTLYFSSNGRKGFGSFDVYYATRLDNTWLNWSEPVNMGPTINTEGRELYYKEVDPEGNAFYTSTVNSDGYGDLKMYKEKAVVNAFVSADSTHTMLYPIDRTSNTPNVPEATISSLKIDGRVLSTKTGEPVRAILIFSDSAYNKAVTATATGYTTAVPPDQEYTVTISANGFISTIQKLDTRKIVSSSMEVNFKLQPIEKGIIVNLKSVLFTQSTTSLLPESFPELDLVASFLKENPQVHIELSGHTDNKGIQAHNLKLSKNRVDKVVEYFVSKGIDPKRIAGKGYGSARPIASNDTEETRRLNRRVEFKVTKF